MKFTFFVLFFIFSSALTIHLGQIQSGKKPIEKQKEVEIKQNTSTNSASKEKKPDSGLTFFVDYGYAKAFRFLKPNGDFFGEELGERANEKGVFTHNFGIGIDQVVSKSLFLSLGLSFIKYGETYREVSSDSLLNYQTSYSYIAVPIQIGYKKSLEKLGISFSTGLQPQFLSAYRKESSYVIGGAKIELKEKAVDNLNVMSIASVSNLKVSYSLSPKTAIYIGASYLLQLNSTFNKQQAYIHKAHQFAGKVGFCFNF